MTSAKVESDRESRYSMGSPVVLKGSDREKFVNTVLSSTFRPECVDSQADKIARKQISKVDKVLKQQTNKAHLATQALPPVPKSYAAPTINNGSEGFKNIMIVVTNDAHARSTNNGYSRRTGDGGFYCH